MPSHLRTSLKNRKSIQAALISIVSTLLGAYLACSDVPVRFPRTILVDQRTMHACMLPDLGTEHQ